MYIIGLRSGADRFFFYTLTMMVTAFAASSQVFTFSAVIGVYKIANPLLLMVITISMVLVSLQIIYSSIYHQIFEGVLWIFHYYWQHPSVAKMVAVHKHI